MVGRVVPRYQTCAQWAVEYDQIISLRQLSDHTKTNRRCALKHILAHIGNERLGSVKPVRVGKMIRDIQTKSAQTAKRVLFEARDFFNEAILAGIIQSNPATPIKPPRVSIQRRRLTLDDWLAIRSWSSIHQPPWVPRMLDLAIVTAQRRSDLRVMGPACVWDDLLHVEQIKTGTRIALPLDLRLEAIGKSIGDVIQSCGQYADQGSTFVRRKSGKPLVEASLSARFEEAREGAGLSWSEGLPPSLHECRSLSERLYRDQGIDTRILLGHKHQSMTDVYNDDRGLTAMKWQSLVISAGSNPPA